MKNDKNNKPEGRASEKASSEGRGEANSTVTTTVEGEEQRTSEQEQAAAKRASGPLTPEEERVIRMLHGKGLKGNEALEFAVGAEMETRLKLALIEASLLEAFEADALEPDPQTGAPRSVFADDWD